MQFKSILTIGVQCTFHVNPAFVLQTSTPGTDPPLTNGRVAASRNPGIHSIWFILDYILILPHILKHKIDIVMEHQGQLISVCVTLRRSASKITLSVFFRSTSTPLLSFSFMSFRALALQAFLNTPSVCGPSLYSNLRISWRTIAWQEVCYI